MPCRIISFQWCDRNVDCLAFFLPPWRRWKGGRAMRAGWSRDTGRGRVGVRLAHAVLACIITHSLSAFLSAVLSLPVSFPSSHILLSSSTYFLGGGGCRYTTRSSVWETQSGTGTDSSRCTDHSRGLHTFAYPQFCSLMLHLKFVLWLFVKGSRVPTWAQSACLAL